MTPAQNQIGKTEPNREEKQHLEETQRAILNILDDFNTEKMRLEDTQRALLNILDDLNQSNEALKKAHDVLEARVIERTAELQQSHAQLKAEMKQRQKAQENLLKEIAFSDTAINSLPGVFYLFKEDGKFLRWNQNFIEVTGYSPEEFARLNPLDLFEGDDKRLIADRIAQVFTTGASNTEASLVCKNGKKIPYYFTGFRMVIDNTFYLIGAGIDIAERKQAEESLKHRTDELARSNAELEQFAYIASHDLQEPLRMVSSYVQLLAKRYKGKLDQDADDFINYASDGALRMQRMINDLLAYSRVGTRGKRFEEISLEEVLEQALYNLHLVIQEKKAQVTHDPLPKAYGDSGQLTQVFQNLIDNAIKFCREKRPEVHISARLEKNECICMVKDNGIGIAPEYQNKLFLLFQRLHTRQEYPGTGIGLAICKRILERHGGRIRVESRPGEGSTFYFQIPVSQRSRNG
ncbi:MAG: ATP-binding protein [Dehalococcoidales bacterium]|nr:ATP-binding protein [Dehalococcoidales bacterium]